MKQKNTSGYIFSFFGPPGSGKGTLAEQCARKLEFQVLSTGNLCRKHISSGTEYGYMLNTYIAKGSLVPDELILDMVKDWFKEVEKADSPIILDGFPRTEKQGDQLLKFLLNTFPGKTYRVVFFELDESEIIKRVVAGRMVCSNKDCQAVFSTAVPPIKEGLCNYCGFSLVKRIDDTVEAMQERLRQYRSTQSELTHLYTKNKITLEKIDTKRLNPQQVFEKFQEMLHNNTARNE